MSASWYQTDLAVDAPFYRLQNPELGSLTDDELLEHYRGCGENEGRMATPLAFLNVLLGVIKTTDDVLEIGPYTTPRVQGPKVKYFDVLDSEALSARAASEGLACNTAPPIDYVSANGDLSIVAADSFDVVFSYHSIEHVPDLLHHLNEIARILRPCGTFLLGIPDKRYCFDHFVECSTVADVVQAHRERRTTHTLANFIAGRAFTTHNDSKRHWAGDHGVPHGLEDSGCIDRAIREHDDANGRYIDLHAWRFTPHSFQEIMTLLSAAGLTRLRPVNVVGTPRNINSFFAVLVAP